MLSFGETSRVFIAREPVDFRRQFDGLCAVARDDLELDPFSGHLFVFFNKRRDRIKILVWQHNGFWLHYKRLERGTFEMIGRLDAEEPSIEVDARQMRMLLDGIDVETSRFRPHFARPLRIGSRRSGGGTTGTASAG